MKNNNKKHEANFQKNRGQIIDLLLNFQSLLEFYNEEDFDNARKNPLFIDEKNIMRKDLNILIDEFFQFEKLLRENAFSGLNIPSRNVFITEFSNLTNQEIEFFDYVSVTKKYVLWQNYEENSFTLLHESSNPDEYSYFLTSFETENFEDAILEYHKYMNWQ